MQTAGVSDIQRQWPRPSPLNETVSTPASKIHKKQHVEMFSWWCKHPSVSVTKHWCKQRVVRTCCASLWHLCHNTLVFVRVQPSFCKLFFVFGRRILRDNKRCKGLIWCLNCCPVGNKGDKMAKMVTGMIKAHRESEINSLQIHRRLEYSKQKKILIVQRCPVSHWLWACSDSRWQTAWGTKITPVLLII